MFKKTLLAVSLSALAMNASAATVANTAGAGQIDVFGSEFVATGTAGVTFSGATTTLGAQYSVGDILKFTITGAEFDLANSTPAVAFTDAGADGTTMTLGLISSDATSLTYRVTAASGDHAGGTADTLALSGMKLTNASAAAASDISITYAAQTSTGIVIDSAATNTAKLMKGVDQIKFGFAAATDKFDATISVGSLRTNFGAAVYTDAMTVDIIDYAVAAGEVLTADVITVVTASKFTVNGDFSFLDTSGDGKITAADKIPTPFAVAGGATAATVATDLQSVVLTGPANVTNAGVTITAGNAAGDTVITDQTFSVDASITYTTANGNVTETATLAAGEWDLDGSSDDIAFLPFGSDYAQSITVTNTGTVEGAITVTLTAGGMDYTKTLSAQASAKSVTNISLEVAAFAAASGITDNARIKVVVNAPSTAIKVKGLYFHKPTADRVLTY